MRASRLLTCRKALSLAWPWAPWPASRSPPDRVLLTPNGPAPKATEHLLREPLPHAVPCLRGLRAAVVTAAGHPRDPRGWEPLWGWSSAGWGTGREEEGLASTQSRKTKTPRAQRQRRKHDGGPRSKQREQWEMAFWQQYNPAEGWAQLQVLPQNTPARALCSEVSLWGAPSVSAYELTSKAKPWQTWEWCSVIVEKQPVPAVGLLAGSELGRFLEATRAVLVTHWILARGHKFWKWELYWREENFTLTGTSKKWWVT